MRRLVSVAALLFAGALFAADPAITGKPTGEWLVELKVDGVEKGTAVIWDFYTEDGRKLGKVRTIPIERAAVFAGPKGKYVANVRLVKGEDVKELEPFKVEITGGVAPFPPVPPVPPSPDVRKDVKYELVYVEDTGAAAAGRGALFTNRTLYDRMQSKGHSVRIVSKNNTGPDVKDEIAASQGKSFPQVFLNDKSGKLPKVQLDAPTTADEVLKMLDKYGG